MTYQHHTAQRAPGRAEGTLVRIAATLERTEHLLAAVLDTLVAMRPEQMPKNMPTIQLPPAYTEKAPPYQKDPHYGFDLNALSATLDPTLMAALPLPPKRGDSIYRVAGPNGELPDSAGTPGAINPDVTDDPAVIAKTLGTPGWTARVRPPVSYTNALKVQVMTEYGIAGNPSDFELDHLCPLCAGGHPTSQQNLWAQRRAGINSAAVKDLTECAAQHAILSGAMNLRDVQNGFCTDWTKLHDTLFKNPKVVASMMMMGMAPPDPEP